MHWALMKGRESRRGSEEPKAIYGLKSCMQRFLRLHLNFTFHDFPCLASSPSAGLKMCSETLPILKTSNSTFVPLPTKTFKHAVKMQLPVIKNEFLGSMVILMCQKSGEKKSNATTHLCTLIIPSCLTDFIFVLY